MFKDNEILARLDEIDSKLAQVQSIAVINDKLDELLVEVGRLLKLWTDDSAEVDSTPTDNKKAKAKPKKPAAESWRRVIWKDVPSDCEISSFGNVRHAYTKKPVPTHRNDSGRIRANIYYTDKSGVSHYSTAKIENLVARAFIDPTLPLKSKSVGHIDGNNDNNSLDNLYVKGAKS